MPRVAKSTGRAVFVAAIAGAVPFLAIAFHVAGCTTFDGLVARTGSGDGGGRLPTGDAVVDASEGGARAPGYLALADGVKLCARINACPTLARSTIASTGIQLDTLNFSACLEWATGPVPPNRPGFATQAGILQCMARANDCGSAGECLSVDFLSEDDKRCKDVEAGTERCADDGLSVVRCGTTKVALHCRSSLYGPNASCRPGNGGTYWCALDPPCPSATCNGSLLQYCGSSGLHSGIVCSVGGYTCGIDPDSGTPDCLSGDRVKACSNVGARCRDDVAVACDGFNESEFDCKALGGTCSQQEGPSLCVLPDATCTPFDVDANGCTGNTLAICVGGRKSTFDCGSVGLACVGATGSRSGRCQ
ncbi:MAG: hypothetical protein U0169_00590 [Polyangiaceae bacterium]